MPRLAHGVGRFLGPCLRIAALAALCVEIARAADAPGPARPAAPAAARQAGAGGPAEVGFAPQASAAVPPLIYPQVHLRQPSRGYRSVPLVGSDAEARARHTIDAALGTGHEGVVEFNETPLREAVRQLEEKWGLQIPIDRKSLDSAGIDPETSIIASAAKGEALRSVLRAMLDDLDLTWVVKGERLVITTREHAEERLVTRLYPLPEGMANPPVDFLSLIDTITNTIGGPAVWSDQGGVGQIRPLEGAEPLLVITQTEGIHGEIEALLRGMHERALAEFVDADGQPRRTPVARLYRCPDKEIRNQLVTNLAPLCNASLAADGDPAAKVTALADHVVVQSAKPDFHALAAQIVAATVGVHREPPAPLQAVCGSTGMTGTPPQQLPPEAAAPRGGSIQGISVGMGVGGP